MSHWYRTPPVISVRSLVQRYAQSVLLDRAIEFSTGNLRALSKDIQTLRAMDPAEKLSRTQIVRLCQEMHALLLTADTEVIPMLIAEEGAPWGVILLSDRTAAQSDALLSLAANQLMVRPSVDQELMAEYVQRNRLLVDLRRSRPSIGVFCTCRWDRAK
jgi:hypothetical protein